MGLTTPSPTGRKPGNLHPVGVVSKLKKAQGRISAMHKLLTLREWISVPEAATYLSSALNGEIVREAEIYRLALDGHLPLSVHFVNFVTGRRGRISRHTTEEIENALKEGIFLEDLKWMEWSTFRPLITKEGRNVSVSLVSLPIGDDRFLTLDDSDSGIAQFKGIYDLLMVGEEKLDVERKYQALTGGPGVALVNIDGTFVKKGDIAYQILEHLDENEFCKGSLAQEKVFLCIEDDKERERKLKQHKIDREKFLNDPEKYFPSGGLPHDAVFVVRTQALKEFISKLNEQEKPLNERREQTLLKQIGALSLLLSEKSGRYKRGDFPNASQIAKAAEDMLSALGDRANTMGVSQSNLRESIADGLKLLLE
jgi:hypothetical protein